jgi:hypothetical protein
MIVLFDTDTRQFLDYATRRTVGVITNISIEMWNAYYQARFQEPRYRVKMEGELSGPDFSGPAPKALPEPVLEARIIEAKLISHD